MSIVLRHVLFQLHNRRAVFFSSTMTKTKIAFSRIKLPIQRQICGAPITSHVTMFDWRCSPHSVTGWGAVQPAGSWSSSVWDSLRRQINVSLTDRLVLGDSVIPVRDADARFYCCQTTANTTNIGIHRTAWAHVMGINLLNCRHNVMLIRSVIPA